MSWFSRVQRFQIGDKVRHSDAYIKRNGEDDRVGKVIRVENEAESVRVLWEGDTNVQLMHVLNIVKCNGRSRG